MATISVDPHITENLKGAGAPYSVNLPSGDTTNGRDPTGVRNISDVDLEITFNGNFWDSRSQTVVNPLVRTLRPDDDALFVYRDDTPGVWHEYRVRFPSLTYTDVKTSNYTARSGEIVLCDSTAGALTITAPNGFQDNRFAVKKLDDTENLITITAAAIEGRLADIGTATLILSEGEYVEFQYRVGTGWLRIAEAQVLPYREIWQGTPIINMAGQLIQWTHVPIFAGQIPLLTSHAGGNLTFTAATDVTTTFYCEVDMNLPGNNQDVDYTITPALVGTGDLIVPRIIDSFAHSRSGSFPRSNQSFGTIIVEENDVISWTVNSAGTGGATCDLDSAWLIFEVG